MLGCNGNVYYAGEVTHTSTFTSLIASVKSTSSTYHYYQHAYALRIQAFDSSYKNPKVYSVNRVYYNVETKNFTSNVVPTTYNDGERIGRYFKGKQACTVTQRHAAWKYVENVVEFYETI